LKNNVRGSMRNQQHFIDKIACILIACSFYFERRGECVARADSERLELPGVIRCRLADDISAVKGLAKFLKECKSPAIFVDLGTDQTFEVPLEAMESRGHWTDVTACIRIPKDNEETTTDLILRMPGLCTSTSQFSISGFPRKLMSYDFHTKQPDSLSSRHAVPIR